LESGWEFPVPVSLDDFSHLPYLFTASLFRLVLDESKIAIFQAGNNMQSSLSGLLLVIAGGIMQGSFTLPMKFMPGWKWENTWLVYTVSGLLIAPWVLAGGTVPHLFAVLSGADPRALLAATVFGMGWGIGSILFGLGVARVGAALGFALILGMTSAIGALAPLLILHPQDVLSPAGRLILVGVVTVLVGIGLSAWAGRLKERALLARPDGGVTQGAFLSGLIICLLSGITSPMMNFSLTFGAGIAEYAQRLGASAANANNATWAPAVTAGAIVNAVYCLWLLRKNRSAGEFCRAGVRRYWLLGIVMGALWMGGMASYGMGAALMGQLGPALGWPLFMATIIITANIWGALTGEWKGAGAPAVRWMIISLVILSIAVFMFGYSSRLP
jgi:L-rhamnose-H+ transport protein